jgi:magnesium-transporting ATPase (P-type)
MSTDQHAMSDMLQWHAADTVLVADELRVDPARGLDEADAAARLQRHGSNRPGARTGHSPLRRFLSQLTQPLVLVLIAAGVVTLFLDAWLDAGVIFVYRLGLSGHGFATQAAFRMA